MTGHADERTATAIPMDIRTAALGFIGLGTMGAPRRGT